MPDLYSLRMAEIDKYDPMTDTPGMYGFPDYRMADERQDVLRRVLRRTAEDDVSYLDVSCGRGESLKIARKQGFAPVVGTEAVPMLVDAPEKVLAILPNLPFGDRVFDVVTCFDVMEHLLREDWEATFRELGRVCRSRLYLCVSNTEDRMGAAIGQVLHVTRLPYEETEGLMRVCLRGFDVSHLESMSTEDGAVWECVRR